MFEQFKSDVRKLPLIIGKVAGGILAAIGIPGAIFIISRTPGRTQGALTFSIAGVIGIAIFIACAAGLKRTHENNTQPTTATKKTKESLIVWAILAALAGVFIFITYLLV
ncbi:MAG: hypothetical protein P1P89_04670 [Desulfobacterales bacterium]|nr:hypothetical protein [Desulfobacterales bacterium]